VFIIILNEDIIESFDVCEQWLYQEGRNRGRDGPR